MHLLLVEALREVDGLLLLHILRVERLVLDEDWRSLLRGCRLGGACELAWRAEIVFEGRWRGLLE